MRRLLTTVLLLGLLACASCTGSGQPRAVVTAEPLHGTRPMDFELAQSADALELRFAAPSAAGTFIRLHLPDGQTLGAEAWDGATDCLHLAVARPGYIDIGLVVPEGVASPESGTATLRLTPAGRTSLRAPGGPQNLIEDLAVSAVGSDQVRLEWTERNVGDYDLNGEVNIADLTPLGRFFGELVSPAQPKVLQPVHWVDGDGNGQVNIADITPIAANYRSSIDGYNVFRNGTRLAGGSPTVPRSLSTARRAEQLPNRYEYETAGEVGDAWDVRPVDLAGEQGTGSSGSQPVDLEVAFGVDGIGLLEGGARAMRIIYPGEDPSRWNGPELGMRPVQTPELTKFAGLPRGVDLLLCLYYAPAIDPATGAAVQSPSPPPADAYKVAVVPLRLPVATGPATSLNVLLRFNEASQEPGPSGQSQGYVSDLLVDFADDGAAPVLTRLEHAGGVLRRDADGDGFSDEAPLADPLRLHASAALLERLIAQRSYSGTANAAIEGTVAGLDNTGVLTLDAAQLVLPGGGQPLPDGTLVRFAETTEFAQRILGSGESDLEPFDLAVGDRVRIELTELTDDALSPQQLRFADSVERRITMLPPDSVYAVPEIETAYPGQRVRVTVYAHETAAPLHELRDLRITYPAACAYAGGSFNVGAPGGSQWSPDGIWAQVAPSGFDQPAADFGETLSGELKVLRLSLDPQGGVQVPLASGALCNFELFVNADTVLGFSPPVIYADALDNSQLFADASNAGQPGIRVVGERPLLVLAGPTPGQGSGTAGDPYRADPAATYSFALNLPGGADVTASPDTVFTVSPPEARGTGSVGSQLNIADDYTGTLAVTGSYRGIPNTDATTVHFFVAAGPSFSLQLDEAATFAAGGAGTFSVLGIDHGDFVEAQVLVSGASELRAAFFTLSFPAELSFSHYGNTELQDTATAQPLVLPPDELIEPFADGGARRMRYGQAIRRPGTVAGLTGDGLLVSLFFDKTAGGYGPEPAQVPSGSQGSAFLPSVEGDTLRWYYTNFGDADQSGRVDVGDLNALARMYYNTSGFPPGMPFPPLTPEFMADTNSDGQIDDGDLGAVASARGSTVTGYRVFGGVNADGDYPNDGTLLDTVPFSAALGDPDSDRLFFEYDLSLADPSLDLLWVVPVFGTAPGAPSAPAAR